MNVTTFIFSLQLVCVLFCCAGRVHAQDSGEWLPSGNFVEVVVASSEEVDGQQLAVAIVERVFFGVEALKGKEIKVECPVSGQSNLKIPSFSPPLKESEKLLLFVDQKTNGDVEVAISLNAEWRCMNLPVRQRNGDEANRGYELAGDWGEFVHALFDVSSIDRYEILRDAAHGDNPAIAFWAIENLAENLPAESTELLESLVQEKRQPLRNRLEADAGLILVRGQDWGESELRQRLWLSWISGELGEQEAKLLYSGLGRFVQRKEIPPCFAWKLLIASVQADTPRSMLELKAGLSISKLLLSRFDDENFQQQAKEYLNRVVAVSNDPDVEAQAKDLLKTL